jgi:uncharacterized protein YcgL (UPF0745 family)
MLCQVFRSKRREGLYIYVEKGKDLTELPAALMERFGPTESALLMMLSDDKKLARTDGSAVMAAVRERGYYLQLPEAPDQEMALLAEQNSKLQR